AGNAAITTRGGVVDFSGTAGPNGDHRVSAGSIAAPIGSGLFLLGANELTVGSNNLSTDVNTPIAGIAGSLVKVGTGPLTFGGFAGNSYTGATTVEGGTLVVNTTIGASSHVSVNGSATLAGGGFVSTVSVASGGTLAPGGTGFAVSVLRTGDV